MRERLLEAVPAEICIKEEEENRKDPLEPDLGGVETGRETDPEPRERQKSGHLASL